MRTAVISDIHGNLEALQAVLADIHRVGVDEICCLGDVVGYGADPVACLKLVCSVCSLKIRGNHEETVLDDARLRGMNPDAAQALLWTRQQLHREDCQEIARWPLECTTVDVRLVHASPDEPGRFDYLTHRWQVEKAFQAFSEWLCFCGHTHQPMVAELSAGGSVRLLPERDLVLNPNCRYLVNVGSVGQPRDEQPEARWVLAVGASGQPSRITFRSVEYNIIEVQKKIFKARLPDLLAYRLSRGF